MTDLSGIHAYGYNNLYRLISATHPQPANPVELYTYDPIGNRLSSAQHPTWSYDVDNRLLSFNGMSYTYDHNGNMISNTDLSGTTTFQYDAENRMIGINKPDGTVVNYRYDPFGRRIEKNVNGIITRYLYDSNDILYELDGSNTILARYTYDIGIDEPLIMRRDGASYYYHADGLGSITHITDDAGSVIQSYVYNTFGEIVTQDGNLPNPYTYTSREYDSELGLYYYRARYYDAKIGRFLQIDPIGFAGEDVNLYAYVANNPINWVDPYGLSEESSCPKKKSCFKSFMEEFERNRVPGAEIFGIPTSAVSLGATIALTKGPSVGEKIAQHFATGAFESQRLTRHGIYVKNYRPGFFSVSGAFRFLGTATKIATVFYLSADITTLIYTSLTFDCEE
jgi:RHS repeat-associated protein